MIRIIRLVHFAKRSEAFNVSLACFIIGSLYASFLTCPLHYTHPKVTVRAIKRSISQIVVVSFWFFLMILVSSGIIYYLERGYFDENSKAWFRVDPSNGQVEKSPFQSIIHAFYWGVITLTTTGYGDEVPFTSWGKFFTCVTVICGVLIVAMPTSILGSSFVAEWTLHQRAKSLAKLKKTRQLVKKSDNPHVALSHCERNCFGDVTTNYWQRSRKYKKN